MDTLRLPRDWVLHEEGGVWTLRWKQSGTSLHPTERNVPLKVIRIGAASGPEALSESVALRMAREYLLSQLPPGAQARRSEVTVAEFIGTRFLPEFVASKTLARRAHYHSVLKLVLLPEQVRRTPGVTADRSNAGFSDRAGWPCLANLRLRDVRADHVQQLVGAALAKGYSSQTVRHICSVISTVFSYAKQELVFLGANPARAVKVPEPDRKGAPALTLTDVEHAVREMRYPEKEIAMIALLTDMNLSEICGLQWKHVNLTGTSSNLDGAAIPPISIAVHKRWYRGELADVKEARRRYIQIPETLLPMLLLLSGRTKFSSPDDFVLSSRSGAALNVTNITARRLASIARKLGIQELTWQRLRRAQAGLKEAFGVQFHDRIAAAAVSNVPHRSNSRKANSRL